MPSLCKGVDFENIAREWRCKYDPKDDKKAAAEIQALLAEYLPKLKAVNGVKSVQRVVCGGCYDFKVITKVGAAEFGDWEGKKFEPEMEFLAKLKAIEGVSQLETQTYTLEEL